MEIDFRGLPPDRCYRLMINLIVPRPIALVTTLGADGVVNAAPFSVFNMLGEDPPLVMISVNKLGDGAYKDTARNIVASRQFVVHIADEGTAVAMDATAAELPGHVSEIGHAGFTVEPAAQVAPPRIVEVPVAFECELHETLESASRFVFIGCVLWLRVRDGLVDPQDWRVDYSRFLPVGRFGAGAYVRLRDRFVVRDGRCLPLDAPSPPMTDRWRTLAAASSTGSIIGATTATVPSRRSSGRRCAGPFGGAMDSGIRSGNRSSLPRRRSALGAGVGAVVLGLVAALLPLAADAQDKLVVGVDGTFAPHAMPKLGGGIEGFNVDMIEAIGRKLGRPVEIFAGEFSGLIPAMNSGKLSFVGAPTTVTPERAKSLLFTEGYLNTYYQFVVAGKAEDLTSLEQLKGQVVSVNRGSAYEKWLDANKARYGFEVAAFPTNADAVQALLSGRAQSHLSGNTVAANSVLKAKPRLKLASLKIDEGLVWGAAFRKDDVALRNAVEGALECLKRDGTIAALAKKWFDVDPGPDEAARKVYPGYGVPGLDGHDPTPHEPKC